jgi:hypothetical protein
MCAKSTLQSNGLLLITFMFLDHLKSQPNLGYLISYNRDSNLRKSRRLLINPKIISFLAVSVYFQRIIHNPQCTALMVTKFDGDVPH